MNDDNLTIQSEVLDYADMSQFTQIDIPLGEEIQDTFILKGIQYSQ